MTNLLKYEMKIVSKNRLIRNIFIISITYIMLFVLFCFYKDSQYIKTQSDYYASEMIWIDNKINYLKNNIDFNNDKLADNVYDTELKFLENLNIVDKRILKTLESNNVMTDLLDLEIERFQLLVQGEKKSYDLSYILRNYENDISIELERLQIIKSQNLDFEHSPYYPNYINYIYLFNFKYSFHWMFICIITLVMSSVIFLKEYEDKTYLLLYTTSHTKLNIYFSKMIVSIIFNITLFLLTIISPLLFSIVFRCGSFNDLYIIKNALFNGGNLLKIVFIGEGILSLSITSFCGLISGLCHSEKVPIVLGLILITFMYYLPLISISGYIPFSLIKPEIIALNKYHYGITMLLNVLMLIGGGLLFKNKRIDSKYLS